MMCVLGGEVVGECTVYYWNRTALADNLDDITADAVGKYEILAAWRLVCAKRLADSLEIDCVAIVCIGTRTFNPMPAKM